SFLSLTGGPPRASKSTIGCARGRRRCRALPRIMATRISLLGGLRVSRHGVVVSRFPTRKTAALLAYLAYHPQRLHPRESLAELLWPEEDPEATRVRLRTALVALRHLLEPPGAGVEILAAD